MSLFSAALALRPLDEQSKSIAIKMNEAMKALSDELDSLLDISKLDADIVPVKRTDLDLSDLVERVASLFQPRAEEKKIELIIDIQDKVDVHTDSILFERLLRNILDNAVKYTQKGSVTCSVRKVNKVGIVTVTDTGIGIDPDDHEQVWEEFYQVNNASRDRKHGLGLGLSVVSRLATLLNIKVRLVPHIGEGASFEIAIPIQAPQLGLSVDQLEVIQQPDEQRLKNKHVLVVDDDEAIQQGAQSLLSSMGMKVSLADGTADAVKIFKQEQIDVVLMDLRLADGDDGFDAIVRLKEIDEHVNVIVMSGDTAPDRLKNAESIGCAWLAKPVKLELLMAEFYRMF